MKPFSSTTLPKAGPPAQTAVFPVRTPPSRSKRRPWKIALRIVVRLFFAFWALVILDGLITQLPLNSTGHLSPGEEVGILHIHTNRNHGGGTPDEVIDAARKANLNFVAITDHNLAFDPTTITKSTGNIITVPGEEISSPSGHFVALGVQPGWREGVQYNTDDLLRRAREKGAIRILAHPYNGSKSWEKWDTDEFEGMEIWNDDAQWRRANPLQMLEMLLMYPVNHELAMVRLATRPDPNITKWDALLRERNVIGVCGSDAHQALPLGGKRILRFPAYLTVFRISKQHVLLASPDGTTMTPRSPEAIMDAIRKGHSFCAVDAVAPAGGFRMTASSGNSLAGIGDALLLEGGSANLNIQLPGGSKSSLIKLYRDGQEIVSSPEKQLTMKIDAPGNYRAEIWLRQPGLTGWGQWLPWIIANPIHIRSAAAANN